MDNQGGRNPSLGKCGNTSVCFRRLEASRRDRAKVDSEYSHKQVDKSTDRQTDRQTDSL